MSYRSKVDPRGSLRSCGASEEECDFLVEGVSRGKPWDDEQVEWRGQRIELNAMTSQQFLDWLEEKVQAAGVDKVVPDPETLAVAYQHLTRVAALQDTIDAALAEPAPPGEAPADLQEQNPRAHHGDGHRMGRGAVGRGGSAPPRHAGRGSRLSARAQEGRDRRRPLLTPSPPR